MTKKFTAGVSFGNVRAGDLVEIDDDDDSYNSLVDKGWLTPADAPAPKAEKAEKAEKATKKAT